MSSGMEIGALGALAVALIALAIWIVLRVRSDPEKRERQRRMALYMHGRLGDALITEVSGSLIFYSYSIHGVQYTASQDVSSLADYLPPEIERLIGPATMKYSGNNPGSSILICEDWSGLRDVSPRDELSTDSGSDQGLPDESLPDENQANQPLANQIITPISGIQQ